MSSIYNIKPGIVAEWISIIDPAMTKDLQYEEKIASVIKSQTDLLLNSNMTEIRAKHWILSKRQVDGKTLVEFALIAYKVQSLIEDAGEGQREFHFKQLSKLRKKLGDAIENEDYLKAAQIRDKIAGFDDEGPAAA